LPQAIRVRLPAPDVQQMAGSVPNCFDRFDRAILLLPLVQAPSDRAPRMAPADFAINVISYDYDWSYISFFPIFARATIVRSDG
jgi:hypothetical protein